MDATANSFFAGDHNLEEMTVASEVILFTVIHSLVVSDFFSFDHIEEEANVESICWPTRGALIMAMAAGIAVVVRTISASFLKKNIPLVR